MVKIINKMARNINDVHAHYHASLMPALHVIGFLSKTLLIKINGS